MKYLMKLESFTKTFEYNKEPKFKVDDYVVAEYCIFYPHTEKDAEFKKYLQTTSGQIILRDNEPKNDKTFYYVRYKLTVTKL